MRVLETTAVYEKGVLKPDEELDIPELERVKVRIEVEAVGTKAGKYSMLDLIGVGKELWESVDVKAYLRGKRESWDR